MAEGTLAATREKPVSPGTTSCAQGLTLGLAVSPSDPRFSQVSLRRLLPRRLLALYSKDALERMHVQVGLRQQLLELGVLSFKFAQPSGIGPPMPPYLACPL